jgi:pimeloyl-ACP methyl ester carboxylesterase
LSLQLAWPDKRRARGLDGLVPNAVAEEYVRLLPDARLEVMPDASHKVTVEQPEQMAELVLAHVVRVAAERSMAAG